MQAGRWARAWWCHIVQACGHMWAHHPGLAGLCIHKHALFDGLVQSAHVAVLHHELDLHTRRGHRRVGGGLS